MAEPQPTPTATAQSTATPAATTTGDAAALVLREPDRAELVDVDRTTLRLWCWGDAAAPPVLLLHGAYDHGACSTTSHHASPHSATTRSRSTSAATATAVRS